MTQLHIHNARDIRNAWMRTARHWRRLGDRVRMRRCAVLARYWGRELVQRKRASA